MNLEEIDLLDLDSLTEWDPLSNALDGCNYCKDEKYQRTVYCIGADLKRVLRGKQPRTQVGAYFLTKVVVELMFQNTGMFCDRFGYSSSRGMLFKISSMMRRSFSLEFISNMSCERGQLAWFFDELRLHAKELKQYLIDPGC